MKEDISKSLAKNILGNANEKDEKKIKEWISQSEKNQEEYKTILKYWKLKPSDINYTTEDVVQRFMFRLNEPQLSKEKHKSINKFTINWKVAATVLVLIGLSIWASHTFLNKQTNKIVSWSKVSSPIGQRSIVVLPDSTEVWLNSGSSLQYPTNFNKNTRNVKLAGEAYFNVKHNESMPFVVEAQNLQIKVLGTSFNVRTYADDENIETTLIEGSVEIGSEEQSFSKKHLNPGEKLSFNKTSKNVEVVKTINPYAEISWIDGKLMFSSTEFGKLINEIERWYNVKVAFDPDEFIDLHYSGTLDNLRIQQVFEFINITIPIHYTIEKNVIILKRK